MIRIRLPRALAAAALLASLTVGCSTKFTRDPAHDQACRDLKESLQGFKSTGPLAAIENCNVGGRNCAFTSPTRGVMEKKFDCTDLVIKDGYYCCNTTSTDNGLVPTPRGGTQ